MNTFAKTSAIFLLAASSVGASDAIADAVAGKAADKAARRAGKETTRQQAKEALQMVFPLSSAVKDVNRAAAEKILSMGQPVSAKIATAGKLRTTAAQAVTKGYLEMSEYMNDYCSGAAIMTYMLTNECILSNNYMDEPNSFMLTVEQDGDVYVVTDNQYHSANCTEVKRTTDYTFTAGECNDGMVFEGMVKKFKPKKGATNSVSYNSAADCADSKDAIAAEVISKSCYNMTDMSAMLNCDGIYVYYDQECQEPWFREESNDAECALATDDDYDDDGDDAYDDSASDPSDIDDDVLPYFPTDDEVKKLPVCAATSNADDYYQPCTINACLGQTILVSMCGADGATCINDTKLVLFDEQGFLVAANDDSCGLCSQLRWKVDWSGCNDYVLFPTCYSRYEVDDYYEENSGWEMCGGVYTTDVLGNAERSAAPAVKRTAVELDVKSMQKAAAVDDDDFYGDDYTDDNWETVQYIETTCPKKSAAAGVARVAVAAVSATVVLAASMFL